MRAAIPIAFMAFLGACASLTPEQCQTGDWRAIGYNDGVQGRLESYISRHFDACGKVGITPDVQAWQAGRQQGLPLYCTPQNAYNVGRGGQDLSPVCPASQQNTLYRSWDWGQEYYLITQQISEYESEERSIRQRIASELSTVPLTPEQSLLLSELNQRLRWLESEIRRQEFRRSRYAVAPY